MLVSGSPSPATAPKISQSPRGLCFALSSYLTPTLSLSLPTLPPFPSPPSHSRYFFWLTISFPSIIKKALNSLLNINKLIYANDGLKGQKKGGAKRSRDKALGYLEKDVEHKGMFMFMYHRATDLRKNTPCHEWHHRSNRWSSQDYFKDNQKSTANTIYEIQMPTESFCI